MDLSEVKRVAQVSSGGSNTCVFCGYKKDLRGLDEAVNHYIQEHGAKMIYIGTETGYGERDQAMHRTVATLSIPSK